MGAWLKTHPAKRADLERLSFEAEGLWHVIRLWCAATGNDGRFPKAELHVAVARKISEAKARRLMAQLVGAGEVLEHVADYEVVGWLEDQPAAAVWDDDTQRERWARSKALRRDRGLCKAIQERDANLCRYCAVRVNWTDRKGTTGGTYDHVDPDGPNTLDNVVVACRRCNARKKDRTPAQAGMVLLTADQLRNISNGGAYFPDPAGLEPGNTGRDGERDLAGIRPRSNRRPDSLEGQIQTGPNQIGARSAARSGQIGTPRPDPSRRPSTGADITTELELVAHRDTQPPEVDYLAEPEESSVA